MSMDSGIVGKVIGSYKILHKLGSGGMGAVYKGRHLKLEKFAALKMMDPRLQREEGFGHRFLNEANDLAKLNHPNIVRVDDYIESESGSFIVMEFVEGYTLADKIREEGKIPLDEALLIFRGLLDALNHAHEINIIHRDIKPSNIMITGANKVKLTDFGLAKDLKASSETVTVFRAGTLAYMSPEQVKSLGGVDNRGDIYSAGMSLYEALAGKLPFEDADNEYSISQKIVEGKIPPPDKINPGIPREMVKVVMRAIETDRGKRYQTAAEMWGALEKVWQAGATEGRKSPLKKLVGRASPLVVYLAAAGFLAIAGFITYRTIVHPPAPDAIVSGSSEPPGSKEIPLVKTPAGGKESGATKTSGGQPEKAGPETGTLILQALPAGSVSVDGASIASNASQQTRSNVTAGLHTVVFRSPRCGEKRFQVDVPAGKTSTLTCYFGAQANIQSLDETGEPLFGTIVVDGVKTDMYTPKSGIRLECGAHTISVTRVGYVTVGAPARIAVNPSPRDTTYDLVFHFKPE